jgi:aspartokinase/homoserine dehydrogenase 1
MKILKFGGTSVGSSERIKRVIDIIFDSQRHNKEIAVVFSAFQNVTDQLIRASNLAVKRNIEYLKVFDEIQGRHLRVIKEIISGDVKKETLSEIRMLLSELKDVLHGIYLVKELSPRTLDFVMSFGERLSALIIKYAFTEKNLRTKYVDARELVITDDNFGNARVNFEITNHNIRSCFKEINLLAIVTGFIGSTLDGQTTTLGRGGSDYTASIFGAALNADEIEIWTDVDGVLTADPRKVKNTFSLSNLTYEEAMELSHFGAKVIHPPTMQPALDKKIPIRIKNTFNPKFEGTLISEKANNKKYFIKGISSIDDISLLRVQGSGMVGVAGIAHRIFGALARKKINIILITQASSEHTVCFAVLPKFALNAKRLIEEELNYEMRDKLVSEILVENDLSIIAVVGEKMRKTPGIAGKVFQTLGKNRINIIAIAQGSSELNISAVISKLDETKALNTLHDTFFSAAGKTVNIFMIGTGLIGSTLIDQIQQRTFFLRDKRNMKIRFIGLANSKKMIFSQDEISLKSWQEQLAQSHSKMVLLEFVNKMKSMSLPNSIFIDCTSSDEIIKKYPEILNSNISIVTPNKKANTSSYKFYELIRQSTLKHDVKFMYNTNVGAGLPIINTIRDMVSNGERILKIEGILSGSLNYIFDSFKKGQAFTKIVKAAKQNGYTEPDPRDDLSGNDVARKLLILARETGLKIELKDIKVENLVPAPARKTKSIDQFFNLMSKYDEYFEKKRMKAETEGKVLRYVAKLEHNEAIIGLESVQKEHAFYSIKGNENILLITTEHYKDNPLVIKGPGAGADVTAAGLVADIIRIYNY